MTKLKKFKETAPEWMTLSLFDCLEMLDPSKTNKFVPMMVNILNEEFEKRVINWGENELKEIRQSISRMYPTLNIDLTSEKITPTKLHTIYNLLDRITNHERDLLVSFMDYHEKNQLPNVDVNQIKDIREIEQLITLVEIKNIGKEFSKQVYVDLENETWCVIRPLTYEASVKYGSSTRWCTSSKNSPYQFFNYSENGILIYCINKVTGYKLAIHGYRDNSGRASEISFWNSKDERIDSLMTDLDFETFQLIKSIITSNNVQTNKELGGKYWLDSFDKNQEEECQPVNEARPTPVLRRRIIEEQETLEEVKTYIEYEESIENISSYEIVGEQ